MNKQEFKEGQEVWVRCTVIDPEPTEDGEVIVAENNFSSELWANLENIIVPPEKVTIPKFMAEWIEYCKENDLTLMGSFDPVSEHGIGLAETFKGSVLNCAFWASHNQELFARAWLDGYEVEQEKLYTVKVPNPGHYAMGLRKKANSIIVLDKIKVADWRLLDHHQLTESEIRKDFDWAWQWAEEVKEVEEER